MTKRWMRWLAVVAAAGLVAACGGGGGDAGDPIFGGDGDDEAVALSVEVQRSGTTTDSVSSSETVQAVAQVTDSSGDPVRGVVVTFAESGPGLLTLAPTAGTALTDEEGRASIDISAANAANTGATTVSASATVAETAVTASQAIQISTNGGGGGSEEAAAAAINFVSASPSGTAIVIRGAGGSGRSESATLTFRVVDGSGAPVEGATIAFELNQSSEDAGVILNTPRATSDSSGVVKTSVTSGGTPTTVIVTSTVTSLVTPSNATVSSQSDTIVVSTAVAVKEAFEINAAKYNLDGRTTGDRTTITATLADENGNPVADGVAVSFTTDAGIVGTSSSGGCLTVDGSCTVPFRVGNPRGTGLATVIATARVGNDQVLTGDVKINMAGSTSKSYIAFNDTQSGPTALTSLNLGNACTRTFKLLLADGSQADGAGRSPAAGTTITASAEDTGITASVLSGTPVADQLDGEFSSVPFTVEVAVATETPASCDADETVGAGTGSIMLNFRTPNSIVFSQRVDIRYPK